MYYLHPNNKLNELFAQRPYQGADPMKAKFVFIGLDANYDTSIEASGIFDELVEYLADGVTFWSKYGVHHPFLLPKYKGDGKLYHRNFSKICENASSLKKTSWASPRAIISPGQRGWL